MARPLIIDGRNLLDPVARAAGFAYEGIGRPRARIAGRARDAEREAELRADGGAAPRGRQGGAARATRRRACRSRSCRSAASHSPSTPSRGSPPPASPRDRRVPRRAGGRVRRTRSAGSAPKSTRSASRSRSAAAAASASPRARREDGPVLRAERRRAARPRLRARSSTEHDARGAAATIVGRAGELAVRRRRAEDDDR